MTKDNYVNYLIQICGYTQHMAEQIYNDGNADYFINNKIKENVKNRSKKKKNNKKNNNIIKNSENNMNEFISSLSKIPNVTVAKY